MENVLDYLTKDQKVILRLAESHPSGRLEIPNATIESINNKNIKIQIPFESYDMFTGREINILWEKYNSFYCLNSTVKKFTKNTLPLLQVEFTDRFECIEKRRYIRLDEPLELNFAIEGGLNFLSAHTIDVSGGGIQFFCPIDLREGQKLEIILEMPIFPYLDIMAKGEVVWVDDHVVGVNFIQIDEADQNRLIKYILEKQSSN
ncbi:MAG: flagellar brake protein [bacterium]